MQWYEVYNSGTGREPVTSFRTDAPQMSIEASVDGKTPALSDWAISTIFRHDEVEGVRVPERVRKAAAKEYLKRHWFAGDPQGNASFEVIVNLIGRKDATYLLTEGELPGRRRANPGKGWLRVGAPPKPQLTRDEQRRLDRAVAASQSRR